MGTLLRTLIGLTVTSRKAQLFNLLVRLIRIGICFAYIGKEEKPIDVNFKVMKLRMSGA